MSRLVPPTLDTPECFGRNGWSPALCPGCVFAPWCDEPLPAPPPPIK